MDDGKFWKIKKIKAALGKNILTPNFEFELPILLKQFFRGSWKEAAVKTVQGKKFK
jgi:hypothetical protein